MLGVEGAQSLAQLCVLEPVVAVAIETLKDGAHVGRVGLG